MTRQPKPPSAANEPLDATAVRARQSPTATAAATQHLLAAVTEESSEAVGVLDASGRWRLLGGAAPALIGRPPHDAVGRPFVEGVELDDQQRAVATLSEVQQAPNTRRTLVHTRELPGAQHIEVESVFVNRLDDPAVQGIVVTTRRSIQPRGESEAELAQQPAGREEFAAAIEMRLGSGASGQYSVAVFEILNHRHVAAGLGHDAAARLMAAILQRLRNTMRPSDCASQIAPNAVALLLDGVQHEPAVRKAVDRLRSRLRAPFHVAGQDVVISLGVGFVTSSRHYSDGASALSDAEAAAKMGGSRPQPFNTVMRSDYRRRVQLAAGLPRALQHNELQVRYQPIITLRDGTIEGFEALCRWLHPDFGMVSPGEFIPLAEQLDWIIPLDVWMLEEACRQAATWNAHTPISLSVNVSGRHLDDANLAPTVANALNASSLPPERLKLEITETAIADGTATPVEMLRSLLYLGVSLAIDDFGTGYASFGQLADLPVDSLKIDRSFVARLDEPSGRRLVHGIISMAHELQLTAVAEGVETHAQLEALRELGCDYAQGYLFAKPLDATDADRLMSSKPSW